MIIKDADDRRPELARRRALLAQSGDPSERMRLKREIRFINAGIRGERDAAYEMRVHWDDSKDWMVIHDLRVEHDGLTAQIDHLIINRWMEFWVCESKHFSQGVAINEHGEFSAFFGSKPYGVPSPIEQNNRHILILRRIIDSGAIDLPRRLGVTIRPDFKSSSSCRTAHGSRDPRRKLTGSTASSNATSFSGPCRRHSAIESFFRWRSMSGGRR